MILVYGLCAIVAAYWLAFFARIGWVTAGNAMRKWGFRDLSSVQITVNNPPGVYAAYHEDRQ